MGIMFFEMLYVKFKNKYKYLGVLRNINIINMCLAQNLNTSLDICKY